MRVFEIMTEGVQTVPPTMPASDAWELMRRKRIHHLVATTGTEIVGVLPNATPAVGSGRAHGPATPLLTS
jgi:CBS domain-containing protein